MFLEVEIDVVELFINNEDVMELIYISPGFFDNRSSGKYFENSLKLIFVNNSGEKIRCTYNRCNHPDIMYQTKFQKYRNFYEGKNPPPWPFMQSEREFRIFAYALFTLATFILVSEAIIDRYSSIYLYL